MLTEYWRQRSTLQTYKMYYKIITKNNVPHYLKRSHLWWKIKKAGICFVSAMHKMEYWDTEGCFGTSGKSSRGGGSGHMLPPCCTTSGSQATAWGLHCQLFTPSPHCRLSLGGGGGARPGSARAVLAARKGFFASCCVIFCGWFGHKIWMYDYVAFRKQNTGQQRTPSCTHRQTCVAL